MRDPADNKGAADLGVVLRSAIDDLDEIATLERIELPLSLRTKIIYWLSRAFDAGWGARVPRPEEDKKKSKP